MPLPLKYQQQLQDTMELAERAARGDARRDFARACAHIAFWTVAGSLCLATAFRVIGLQLGMIWYWLGCIIWFGGVSFSILGAYRRGEKRGDW